MFAIVLCAVSECGSEELNQSYGNCATLLEAMRTLVKYFNVVQM